MARTFAMHAQQISGIKGGRLGWISKKKKEIGDEKSFLR